MVDVARILVIEDEAGLRNAVKRHFKRSGKEVHEASTCAQARTWLAAHAGQSLDLVLLDLTLPDGEGMELVQDIRASHPRADIVIMTGDASIDNAIRALQRGAAWWLSKPFEMKDVDEAIRSVQERRTPSVPGAAPRVRSDLDLWRSKYAPGLLGSAEPLLECFRMIERVSDTDCSVLVTGPSGTGKELVARAIHTASDRSDKPFITVNCAAIPENLLESELFGHAKGAFTGASQSRIGRFMAANGGTIFLDEIGELPLSLQAKLLRVLQEKEVTPVGEHQTHKIDVRVVSATNRDLEEMVEAGLFRPDLMYRLDIIPIELPALSERKSDVPILVQHFLRRSNEKRNRSITGIDVPALKILSNHDWPGNIRQLENTIERMVVLKGEGELTLDDLPRKIRDGSGGAGGQLQTGKGSPALPDDGLDLRDAVDKYEEALIRQALERTGWNKNRAAAILQMNRTTLVEKLKKKNIENAA